MNVRAETPAERVGPILGVGGVLFDGGRVLLVKRGAHPAKGYWSIPGGKLAAGETLAEGVEREMLEETGLRVRARALVEVYERLPGPGAGRAADHYVVLDYLCEAKGGLLRAGDDAAAVGWFALKELDALHLTPGAAPVIEKAFRMTGGISGGQDL
ncbi:MAG: NUDIX hydrolase [Bryobacterales bacterium]|nr:NUDIX hydrolase [Bryobacterales bacterium]